MTSLECHSEGVVLGWFCRDLGTPGAGRVLPVARKLLVKESFPLSMVLLRKKTISHELYDLISGSLRPKAA